MRQNILLSESDYVATSDSDQLMWMGLGKTNFFSFCLLLLNEVMQAASDVRHQSLQVSFLADVRNSVRR